MRLKNLCTAAGKCLLCLLLAVLLGTAAMTAVYALPTGRMHTNVDRSIPLLENEGGSFFWAPPDDLSTRLDGFTDAIMMQTAIYNRDRHHLLQEAMLNRRVEFYETGDPITSLIRYVYGEHKGPISSYSRYWNGYLLYLKPLLLFFSLPQIRAMDACFQFCLAAAVLLLAYRKRGTKLAVPMALMILSLNPISTAMSLQYTSMYVLTLGGALAMLSLETWKKENGYLLFLFLGIGTAFFDFLTYPAAAVGVCLALQALLDSRTGKEALFHAVGSGAAWAFGYGGMWGSKWVLAQLLTGENVLSDALAQVRFRSGSQASNAIGSAKVSFLGVVGKNLSVYLTAGYMLLAIGLLAALLWLLLGKHYRFSPDKGRLAVLALCFAVPFVWYLLLRNHSSQHYWMTHRNLSAAVFALAGFVCFSLHNPKEDCSHG